MAFALKGTGSASTANSTTANQSTLVVTTATTAGAAGDLAVLIYALDNNQTTDGDENAVTAVTDSGGNQWRKAVEFTNGQGTAQTGATCGLWFCNLRNAIAIGGTVTLTFSNVASRDATAASLTYYTKAAGYNAELAGVPGILANDAAAAGSLNSTTANIACLRVRGIASEALLVTALTPTASFAIVTQSIATTGVAATSMSVRGEWIINTSTGTASAPSGGAGAVDNASVYAAFLEVPIMDWLQPLSLPVRRTIQQARRADDGIFNSPDPPPNTRWFQPLSLPVRKVTPTRVNLFPFAAQASQDISFGWFTPLAEPVRSVRAAQKAYPLPFTAAAAAAVEIITVDKWFVSFTNPVRIKPQLAAALQQPQAFVPVVVQVVSLDWLAPLSVPVRVRTSPANQQALALAPNPIVPTGWSAPLSEPSRRKQRAIADYAYAPLFIGEVVTVDKWFNPLAPPLNAKRGLNAALQQAYTTEYFPDTPNASALIGWFNPLSEPVRAKRFSAQDQSFVPFVAPEVVTVDKWFKSFAEPVRAKRFSAPDQSFVQLVTAEVITVDKWFVSLTDPVRRPRVPNKVNLFPFAAVIVVQPDINFGWFAPLTDPVRKVPTAQKAYPLPFSAQANAAEIVTVDKWFVSFTDPVRVKPGLATALQQSLAFVKAAPFPETVTEDRWHQPLSEPLRSKPGLRAASQAAFFAPSTVITTEIVTVDKWFESFADLIRRKPEERNHFTPENEFTAIAANMKWFAPLNVPVRQKIGLVVTEQQALAFVATVSETITVDKWFAPLADPVRVKPALLTGRQQFLTWPTQIIIPSVASWWRPLSDPPKAKTSLAAANQRFEFRTADFIPHPDRFLEGWYNWWSEPVRSKPGLAARFQSSWIGPHRVISTTVTLDMSATETGVDVATFAITVLPYNPPASAVVSLKEIGTGASLTSIVEIGDDGSLTSVVES